MSTKGGWRKYNIFANKTIRSFNPIICLLINWIIKSTVREFNLMATPCQKFSCCETDLHLPSFISIPHLTFALELSDKRIYIWNDTSIAEVSLTKLFYLKLHERSDLLPSVEKQNIQTVYCLGVCMFLQLFKKIKIFYLGNEIEG